MFLLDACELSGLVCCDILVYLISKTKQKGSVSSKYIDALGDCCRD